MVANLRHHAARSEFAGFFTLSHMRNRPGQDKESRGSLQAELAGVLEDGGAVGRLDGMRDRRSRLASIVLCVISGWSRSSTPSSCNRSKPRSCTSPSWPPRMQPVEAAHAVLAKDHVLTVDHEQAGLELARRLDDRREVIGPAVTIARDGCGRPTPRAEPSAYKLS